jgi:serine/threonine protein phosphatase PrpC
MICPNCGKRNRDAARFCQHCGASLPPTESRDAIREKVTEAGPMSPEEHKVKAPPPSEAQATEGTPVEGPMAIGPSPLDSSQDEPDQEASEPETGHEGFLPEALTETEDLDLQAPIPASAVEEQESVAVAEAALQGAEPALAETGEGPVSETEQIEPTSDEGTAIEPEDVAAAEAADPEPTEPTETVEPLAEDETEEELVPLETDHAGEPQPEDSYQAEMEELTRDALLPWLDNPRPLLPLELGTIVNGRYRIVELLSDQERQVIYRVRDLQRCPQCGFTGSSPDEAFCPSCGAAMDQKPIAMMLERPIERSAEPVEARIEDHFSGEERAYWIWREVKETGPLVDAERMMQLIIGQRSDTGQIRELDEDSLFVLTMSRTHESMTDQLALLVVADGMGGHEGGEVASKVAVQTLTELLIRHVFLPELEGRSVPPDEICSWLVRAVEAANDQVYLERQKRQTDMGTTMTAALLKDWTLCLAHVGDCRGYVWGEDGLQQLTTDHSIVASMIAAGAVQPGDIYTHPQRSVIYRCIGDQPSVEVDSSTLPLRPGDRLVLCCDGLWEMIHNEGIEDVMLRESDPQTACDVMVEQANVAGGTDNISVIVAQL